MKRIVVLFMVLVLILSTSSFAAESFKEKEVLVEPNVPRKEVIKQLKENKDRQKIHVLGDITVDKIDELIHKKDLKSIKELKVSKKVKTLWVSEEHSKEVLSDIDKLKDILDKGTAVYFIDLKDMNILGEKLRNDHRSEESLDNRKPDYQYVTQNKEGDYFIGKGYFDNITESDKQEVLLASSWNRRNDKKYTTPMKEEQRVSQINKKIEKIFGSVSYANSSDFQVANEWKSIGGWDPYEFTSAYGDVSEWKSCYHYNDGYDDYYAMVASTYVTPGDGWNDRARHLDVVVDCDSEQSGNEMFKYSPESQPESNTYSFSVGAGTNGEATIGASWDIKVNDLDVDFEGTSMSSEDYQVRFDYNEYSTYSRQESRQDWCVIVQRSSGTYCKIVNTRRGYFYGTTIFDESDCGHGYITTIYE